MEIVLIFTLQTVTVGVWLVWCCARTLSQISRHWNVFSLNKPHCTHSRKQKSVCSCNTMTENNTQCNLVTVVCFPRKTACICADAHLLGHQLARQTKDYYLYSHEINIYNIRTCWVMGKGPNMTTVNQFEKSVGNKPRSLPSHAALVQQLVGWKDWHTPVRHDITTSRTLNCHHTVYVIYFTCHRSLCCGWSVYDNSVLGSLFWF